MAEHAGESFPKACGSWGELMGVYRLLSNPSVDAAAIQGPHREATRKACAALPVVLAVSDITDLDFTGRKGIKGLGRIGDGGGRGLQQHTTLAVSTEGSVIGVLRQHFYRRPEAEEDETRRARQARWCESDVWSDAARAIGACGRLVHVSDRGSDNYRLINTCFEVGAGFVIRAMHDRRTLETGDRLHVHAMKQPVLARERVEVSAQRVRIERDRRVARVAEVTIRAARATIPPPVNDPRSTGSPPREVCVVYVREENPPAHAEGDGIHRVEWMLLTSEPVSSAEDARRIVAWYARRWIIEEFHRVGKEGCRLEKTQLDDALDIERLASITAIVAVRLLQLRDAASGPDADNPGTLRQRVPPPHLRVVAALARTPIQDLTPKAFWNAVARRGGWLGRKHDPRPGWKCIWRGWHDIALMAQGAELLVPMETS